MEKHKCHDCGVEEGRLHRFGCDMERCPFCGKQLITCNCVYEKLNLYDKNKYDVSTAYLPKDIYENGLTEQQDWNWLSILIVKGRVPYVVYPYLCAMCGYLYPEMFKVPDEEWQHYIQIDKQKDILCFNCYNDIKNLIDNN